MVSRYMQNTIVLAVVVGLCTFVDPVMAGYPLEDIANKVSSDLKAINDKGEKNRAAIGAKQQGGTATPGGEMALKEAPEEKQDKPTQVSMPKDKKTAAAIEEAMPLITKIVSLHRCMKNNSGLRQWNFDAVSGVDMMKFVNIYWPKTGLPIEKMEYHDNNKCLSAKTLDQFSMPAMNALLFRAVYFADDSGETDNYLFLFMKTDDGWKIKQFERGRK